MAVKETSNRVRLSPMHLKVAIVALTWASLALPLSAQEPPSGSGQEERREISVKNLDAVFPEAAIDRIRVGDLDVDFIQFIPRANREYTCIGPVNDGVVTDLECFPTKTNQTPTMY